MAAPAQQTTSEAGSTGSQPRQFERTVRFTLAASRRSRGKFILFCALGVVELAVLLGTPQVSAALINNLVFHSLAGFLRCVYLLLALTLIGTAVGLGRSLLRLRIDEALCAAIRSLAFRAIVNRELRRIEQFPQGDFVSRVLNDTIGLADTLTGILAQIAFDVITIAGLAVLMLRMQFGLGLAVVIAAPAPVLLSHVFSKRISAATDQVRKKFSDALVAAYAWLSDPVALKLFRLERRGSAAFARESDGLRDWAIVAGTLTTWVSSTGSLLLSVPSLVIFAYGGAKVLSGSLRIGELFAFSAYSAFFTAPTQRLVQMITVTIPTRLPMFQRVMQLIDPPHGAGEERSELGSARRVEGVSARDVCFHLDSGFTVNVPRFEARRGEIIGITGPNGSGKTTFLKLLAGLYQPDRGSVTILEADGTTLDGHERVLAALPQKQTVYPGTIAENVTLFSMDGASPDLSRFCGDFPLLDWVEALPDGWNTKIEGGVPKMSGGQLQRIGLGRILYANAAINLFDEPTTALDANLLPFLSGSIQRLARDRIVIIVTHSAEALRECDRVYEMRKLDEEGMSWELADTSQREHFAH